MDAELSNDALDRAIRQALAIDPSPEFLPRVRDAIAAVPSTAAAWPLGGLGIAAAAAAAVLTIVAVSNRTAPPSSTAPATSVRAAGSDIELLRAPAPSVVQPPARVVLHRLHRAEPEIMLSSAETEGLRQLLASIGSGRVDTSTLSDWATSPEEPLAIPQLQIAPIDGGH